MIRTYQPGDASIEVAIYNVAAAHLPGFKPARAEEIERRARNSRDFDPNLRFIAEVNGEPVATCHAQPNGRISFPWSLPGYEGVAPEVFEMTLRTMRAQGIRRVMAAYHRDWTDQRAFFESQGMPFVRDMINYALPIRDVPTLIGFKSSSPIRLIQPSDLPEMAAMMPGLLRLSGEALEKYLFLNPLFQAENVFVLPARSGGLLGVGLFIADPHYSGAMQGDPNMPCFRLGAFGTEGLSVKRVHGLFSCVVRRDREPSPIALDLLAYALDRLDDDDDHGPENLAAQVPSDAPGLVKFYQNHFKHQGQFPVFERYLD